MILIATCRVPCPISGATQELEPLELAVIDSVPMFGVLGDWRQLALLEGPATWNLLMSSRSKADVLCVSF